VTLTWQDSLTPSSISSFDKKGNSVGLGGSCQSTNLNIHVPQVALPPHDDGKKILLFVNAFNAVSSPLIVTTLFLLTVIFLSPPPPNNLSNKMTSNVTNTSTLINIMGVHR